ncbi:MAG: MBL fold metallo-hydrolase [Oscillospiraceae bacterium]|nr:MBL fold metallo-hydrolase [Oscillospiraceae bacterium]
MAQKKQTVQKEQKGGKVGAVGITSVISAILFFIAYLMGWVDVSVEGVSGPETEGSGQSTVQKIGELDDYAEDELRIHIIDVGQGDSIFIQAPSRNILIDAGEEGYGPTVMGYLDRLGVDSVDVIIATHPHSDHIGDMDYVIKNLRRVGVVYTGEMPESAIPTTRCYENFLNAIIQKDADFKFATIGTSLKLGENSSLKFVGPVEPFEEYNNNSLVCRVTFGSQTFLFGGDSSKEAEELLLKKGTDISCDYMHVAHHGSSSSTTQEYLDAVDPKYATISCGEDNSYGHPNSSVVERLEKKNVEYYRTDISGNIVVVSDGESINIFTEK